jgi:hypothetical protein
MILSSLRASQLSPVGLDWYTRFLGEVDGRDADQVLAGFHDACVIQVNDRLPAYSKAAIASGLSLYYQMFEKVEHEVLGIYGSDQTFVAELLCHYTPVNNGSVTMPAAVVYERDADGLIVSMRLYVSAGSMFEAFTGAPR